MSDLKLALAYLRARMLVTVLTVVSVALGLGLATGVFLFARQTKTTLVSEAGTYDLVVGAKGSPLQLVLNSIYFLDAPVGNIEGALWTRLQKDPSVASAVPVTMGDNYLGSPIVGTTPEFLDGRKALGGAPLVAQGQLFRKPFEAVVGAEVARKHGTVMGQQLVGAHGWTKSDDLHPQFPYTVVGLLAPTGTALDRGVYTDYHSTWVVHEYPDADEAAAEAGHEHHGHEVTAVLVRLKQAGRRFMMVQDINTHESAMAAIPVDQISRVIAVFIAPLQGLLLLVAYLVVLVSALSVLISLYLTIHQRRRDIAIIRSIGATREDVFRMITAEAAAISGLGVIAGWLIGHGLVALLGPLTQSRFGICPSPWQAHPTELAIGASVWMLGILAGLLPAVAAYRLPVADVLGSE